MRSQRMRQLSAKLTPSWSKHVFALRTKRCKIFTMQECSPSSTPTTAVRGKEKPSKEEQRTNEVRKSAGTSASQKGGKKPSALKDNTSEGSSNITLNAAALGSALAEALKSSFERPKGFNERRFHWPGRLDCFALCRRGTGRWQR